MSRQRSSRRANGEGSVYKRTDGRWVATAYDVDGRLRPFYGATRTEAIAKRRDALDRLATGAPTVDSRTKLRTVYGRWESSTLVASTRRQSTQALYRTLLRVHALPVLGDRPIGGIRPSDVERLMLGLEHKLAASSRRSLYAALNAMFKDCVRDGLLARNPVAVVRRPTLPHHEAAVLDAAQLRVLLDAAAGERLEGLWILLAGTGVRRGEALGLRWDDVDLDAGVLRVRRTLGRVAGIGIVETEPKTTRGRRTLDLAPPVVTALRAHRQRQLVERLAAGSAWSDENRVIATTIGTALEPRSVSRAFKVLAEKAGVVATPHTLRHSAATQLLREHMVSVVSMHLGHSTASITLDVYGHALPADREAAAKTLGDFIS